MEIISRYGPAYLIRDKSLSDIHAPFYEWIRSEGFEHAWYKGHYDSCPWCFINIEEKLFAYGMPGVGITKPIGGKAISINEFKRIYEKYQNN